MRISRKGRKRLAEAAQQAEAGRKRWGDTAFRLSRKRRKRLAQAEAEPLYKRFALQNMRMTRSRRRKMREEAVLRQTAQAASIGALALLPAAASEAAAVQTFTDIPAAFQSLRDERNRIRDFKAAKRNAEEAAAALVQAEAALQSARHDKRNAEQGLKEARQNLVSAQENLKRIARELAQAQAESAQRTQEAIAAQQAVADFAPQVWAQASVVQDRENQRDQMQVQYEELGRELGYLQNERDGLEERIRQAWESVDWAQNRLNEVMAMVSRAQELQPEQTAKESLWQDYESQLQDLDAAVDEAEALLDALNSQLDELQAARDAAEDAERDARELVRELTAEQQAGEHDLRESEAYVAEAEKWQAEAEREVKRAETDLSTTRSWKEKADYELEHFGEGKGLGLGLEYYSWHGAGLPGGHQLYQPIEFYAAEKKWDVSVSTGWLTSDTGLYKGQVSGWTDTTLGIVYKNNHKLNDVHYKLDINIPTGQDNVHQNAMMIDGLARFNSFSEGWQFKPGIEATQHFSESDSLTGRLSYAFRGKYQYRIGDRGKFPGKWADWLETYPALAAIPAADRKAMLSEAEGTEYVDPGNQFSQELEYRHAGEQRQFMAKFRHVNSSYANKRSVLDYYVDDAGKYYQQNLLYNDNSSLDGEDWTLQFYYSQDVDGKNSWQSYAIGNYQEGATGGTHRYYGGLGWTHQFDKWQRGYVMFNYGETHGSNYNLRLTDIASNRRLRSVILGYNYRVDEQNELAAKLERYTLNGSAGDDYNGWNMSLMWNRSF